MHSRFELPAPVEPIHAVNYREGRNTCCPDCGGRQWLVGRLMAQCAHCDAALPLERSYHRRAIIGFS
ncbi:MAG: hypothetical protein ABW048_04085 [Sphingobium sp.]